MKHYAVRVRMLSKLNSLLFSLLVAEQHGPTSSTWYTLGTRAGKEVTFISCDNTWIKISSICSRVIFLFYSRMVSVAVWVCVFTCC